MKNKVRILHLSDIHLHDPDGSVPSKKRGNKREIFDAFLNADFSDPTTHNGIDLILITGDIYDGPFINSVKGESQFIKVNQYGKPFFNRLLSLCPRDRILFCYGNHDLTIHFDAKTSKRKSSQRFKTSSVNSQSRQVISLFSDYYNEHIKHGPTNPESSETTDFEKLHSSLLLNYYTRFLQKFINDATFTYKGFNLQKLEILLFRNVSEGFPFYRDSYGIEKFFTFGVVRFEPLNLIVAVINSSWQNVDSNFQDGHLSLGQYQVDMIERQVNHYKSLSKRAYVVTLMHNAFNSLGYSDVHNKDIHTASFISRISRFSDLILSGHEHGELPPSLVHLECYLLKTGGLLNNDDHSPRNSYSVIDLDFEKRELYRHLFIYNEDKKKFTELRLEHDELPFNNYYQFELYPKEAQKSFVAQQRDIEDYLKYFKEFRVDYNLPDSSKVPGYHFDKEFKAALMNSPNSQTFFLEKDKIVRKKILSLLSGSKSII